MKSIEQVRTAEVLVVLESHYELSSSAVLATSSIPQISYITIYAKREEQRMEQRMEKKQREELIGGKGESERIRQRGREPEMERNDTDLMRWS